MHHVGYWERSAGNVRGLADGAAKPGDLGPGRRRGLYRAGGRGKEMFIRGGYNVYPLEVESILGNHPAIAEIAVVGRPDEIMGEIGVAVIVVSDGHEPPTLASLRDFGSAELAPYKLPEAVRVTARLPRNATDKVDRRALTEFERQTHDPGH